MIGCALGVLALLFLLWCLKWIAVGFFRTIWYIISLPFRLVILAYRWTVLTW